MLTRAEMRGGEGKGQGLSREGKGEAARFHCGLYSALCCLHSPLTHTGLWPICSYWWDEMWTQNWCTEVTPSEIQWDVDLADKWQGWILNETLIKKLPKQTINALAIQAECGQSATAQRTPHKRRAVKCRVSIDEQKLTCKRHKRREFRGNHRLRCKFSVCAF